MRVCGSDPCSAYLNNYYQDAAYPDARDEPDPWEVL